MTKQDDGGPAFPPHPGSQLQGMSLRDWFAGLAMLGYQSCGGHAGNPEDAVKFAYQCADLMLLERVKPAGLGEAEAARDARYLRVQEIVATEMARSEIQRAGVESLPLRIARAMIDAGLI